MSRVKKSRSEKELFDDYKSGLFTVYGSQRGTGFLADSSGLVLTNAHLLDGVDEVRVMTDSNTKVYARKLVVDPAHDLAVLAIPARRCTKCTTLPMFDSAKTTLPTAGDRVLALGSPFNKAGVLSTGIVSNADQQSITSEVSLGYLNDGCHFFARGGVRQRDDGGVSDRRMFEKRGLDLSRENSRASDEDRVLRSPGEEQVPVSI